MPILPKTSQQQKSLVASYQDRQQKLVPYADALRKSIRDRLVERANRQAHRSPVFERLKEFPLDGDSRVHRLVAVLHDVGAER